MLEVVRFISFYAALLAGAAVVVLLVLLLWIWVIERIAKAWKLNREFFAFAWMRRRTKRSGQWMLAVSSLTRMQDYLLQREKLPDIPRHKEERRRLLIDAVFAAREARRKMQGDDDGHDTAAANEGA